jgi:hypothetical protein
MAKFVLPISKSLALFFLALPAFAQPSAAPDAEGQAPLQDPGTTGATAPTPPTGTSPTGTSPAETPAPAQPPAPAPGDPRLAQSYPPPAAPPATPPSAGNPSSSAPLTQYEVENAQTNDDAQPAAYGQGTSGVVEPPPPPVSEEKSNFELPDFSVRVDPLNWLLAGRLGFELESGLWKFISVEVIPVFVVNEKPPLLNLSGIPDTLKQQSNGVGALAGASIGAGFWLNGKPFQGTVLRFYYTNYGYKYLAEDSGGKIDGVTHTERFLVGMIGSHSKWGPFTIASGIGLGVEMNREQRCYDDSGAIQTKGCPDDEIQLRVRRAPDETVTAVTGPFHPVYILGRLSLGVVF